MSDIAEQDASGGLVHNQPDICIDAHRPEIRVSRAVEFMKMEASTGWIELQVECRGFYGLLFRPCEPRKAVGEGIRNPKFH
jgi:hypothetical protein